MESASGSGQGTSTSISASIVTTTNTTSTATTCSTISTVASTSSTVCTTPASNNSPSVSVSSTPANVSAPPQVPILTQQQQIQQAQQQQQQLLPACSLKSDDVAATGSNLSQASGISEGQRSLSGAPSASSSPISSPQGKIFGRNANGTTVATSRPGNEAEMQLYRVLQRASLLIYYDTLLEMGGDDVQQLYEAGEEEFLEIMALVGMASKPLHVRRLQKALHEWAINPTLFHGSMAPSPAGLCETPTKPSVVFTPEPSPSISRSKFPTFNPTPAFNPTPLMSTAQTSSSQLLSQMCATAISVPVIQPHTPHTPLAPLPTTLASATLAPHQPSGSTAHQVTSSSPQLTPVLTELQIARITQGAEKIANQLPQREPRAQTSKKRTSRELEQVMAMNENDPRRMEEIRKYSAIYGRFDCKRRPEKPLTLHEVCVNEAAAQLCRLVPALLTRRDELFPLARQIVKDAGFGHSASIARYGGLLPQVQVPTTAPRSSVLVDCESSDSAIATASGASMSASAKRQRLSSTETSSAPDLSRDATEDSRYNLFAMYQKFAKPPFDLSEIARFSLAKSEYEDNDNDSRYSFSNSSSPHMPHNGSESERDALESLRNNGSREAQSTTTAQLCTPSTMAILSPSRKQLRIDNSVLVAASSTAHVLESTERCVSPLAGVQVISAAGSHIIAVANPALALSPTLNEALSLKRETTSPDP